MVAQARNGGGIKPMPISMAMEGVEYRAIKRLTARTLEDISPGGERVIRLHKQDILRFHLDGSITIDTGEHISRTTHQNINRFLPYAITIGQVTVDTLEACEVPKRKMNELRLGKSTVRFAQLVRIVPTPQGLLLLARDEQVKAPFISWCLAGACHEEK